VLGVLLIAVIGLYTSCGGSDGSGAERKNTGATATTPAPTAAPEPSPPSTSPENEEPVVTEPTDPQQPPLEPAPPPQSPALTGPCTNDEMTLTPLPAKTSAQRGTPMDLRLKIANSSSRTCSRDVGADLQELRLVKGTQTIWSSDRCGPARGSDVRSFGPGADRQYMVTWNGKSSVKCTSGVPSGPVPVAGDYQLIARLGDKLSEPVKLTLR
jgi:hypothetical protein